MLPRGSIGKLAVTFLTYGFKHGAPRDADLLFDVRFLPNPHYEAELRPLTGLDPAVREYVEGSDGIDEFYDHLVPLLDYLLPQYEQEGKAHLTIGIGCTGGRHRSVVIAEHLARNLSLQRRLHGRRGAPRHREAAAHAPETPEIASPEVERECPPLPPSSKEARKGPSSTWP